MRLSLPRDPQIVQIELDTDGDGIVDVTTAALEDYAVVYSQPGLYVVRATVSDAAGARTTASAAIQVFDRAALDALLRARWSAMKDALRRGDIAAGVSHITQRRRADYETAFTLLAPSLPQIDAILPEISLVRVRNAAAIYVMRRTDAAIEQVERKRLDAFQCYVAEAALEVRHRIGLDELFHRVAMLDGDHDRADRSD